MRCGYMNRKLITVWDVIMVFALLVVFVFIIICFNISDVGRTAVVRVDNKEVMRLSLADDCKEKISGLDGYNLLSIKDGKCSVLEANCRDGICKNRGEIYKKGESIVCLPHKLIVEIE